MKILGMGLPELLMVLLFVGVLILIVVLVLRRSNKKKQSTLETPCQQDGSFEVLNTSQVPVLETWKTSVGFSVLGAISRLSFGDAADDPAILARIVRHGIRDRCCREHGS